MINKINNNNTFHINPHLKKYKIRSRQVTIPNKTCKIVTIDNSRKTEFEFEQNTKIKNCPKQFNHKNVT